MRRAALLSVLLTALAVPAAAYALRDSAGDGTLVVHDGTAPRGVPVVFLVINGTAIGQVSTGSPGELDTVIIDDVNNTGNIGASLTNGSPVLTRKTISDTETKFTGSDFRFRAAAGWYRIWIYGSGVDMFAVGQGKVTLQGTPGAGITDGQYSFNGGAWRSLPPIPSDWLPIKAAG